MKAFDLLLVALLLSGCRKDSPADGPKETAEAAHHDEGSHDELPTQVRLSPQAVTNAGIHTEQVRRQALTVTVRLVGEVAPVPDRSARLSAPVAGRLEQVSFNEGSVMKKGEVMALMRVPDVGRLRGAFAAANARAKAAASNAQRLRALRESKLAADQAVLDAEAEARAQEAEANSLGEQLSALGANAQGSSGLIVSLRSPIAGVVVARDAVIGQPISADHVLASIVDLSQVWFLGRIFEKDLSRLRTGARADVQANAFPGEHFDGQVEYVGQQIDPLARTLTARILLPNPLGKLRLGLFGTASVEVAQPEQVTPQLMVPRSGVTQIAGKSVVFVKAADGDFVLHEVTLGEGMAGSVQVLSGLTEGEEVATSGVFTLKSLVLKSTLTEDEGH